MAFLTFANRILTLLLLAGCTLVLLFIVLSGSVDSFPFNKFYWLQADTSSIDNAKDVSRWTFWGVCNPDSYDSSTNGQCGSLAPDKPLSPLDNFGNSTSLPQSFVSNRDTYYYLSRFSFPLILIALVFSGISLICAVFQSCWLAMKQVLSFFVTLGLITAMAGVACETAVAVLVKNKFKNAGMSAKLGPTMLGLSWAAVACLILTFFLSCCSTMRSAYKIHKDHVNSQKEMEMGQIHHHEQQPSLAQVPQENTILQQNQGTLPSNEGGIRFFKIKRTQKTGDEESI
ncbi:hypothetical protein CANARDRAFT_219465 [[Candida] arabinofermentans NRRL YB-2248]|uniref:Uncharacterized protein n=1 Tax=[Candida] arabinofermentans NRRL YB-2248 TaxID=983967 RepID=A0A1E4T3L1_9ASCO|nr:hypothetical protein CANARDRAFT_219465 [[Candida] arabinofermentans NRRL YB-2248]